VAGKLVLVNLGGSGGAGITAFDTESGKLAWKATDHEASYSAPVLMDSAGERLAVFFTRSGVVGIDAQAGKVRFEYPWRSRQQASVNAATPLIDGDRVFVSASYNTGAVLLRVKPGGVEKIWSGDDSLSNHYATSVLSEGYLYGYDGRQESGPRLRCVEFNTGKVAWTRESFGAGSVLKAGSSLLLLLDTGELVLADASPSRYVERARAQVLGTGTRAYPALADGFLLARDKTQLVCLDLRPEKN
jgi:outer membrane protein assembly factor BamB